jgi:glycosyltransferase involved in cell wall biosynthesis
MKLLIAADIFPPQAGGPATYVVNLANALVKDGWGVKIVSLNPDGDEHVTRNTHHATSRNKLLRYWQYFQLLRKHAKNVDVIYAMGPVNAGLPALIVAKLQKKKFVTKVVGDYAWEQGIQRFGVEDLIDPFQKKNNYSPIVRLLKWIESLTVKHANKVIVPSSYLKMIVVGWGAKEDRVEVVYNAIAVPEVAPAEKPAGERWIVSVGRIVPWKGMGTLIAAMPNLVREMPDIRLKIVGDGPTLEELREQVIDSRLENYVDLFGRLPREETLRYIAAADVFVLNSAYEGLPHVLLEAAFLHTPSVASDAGGNPEVLPKEYLFPYNDQGRMEECIRAVLAGGTQEAVDQSQFTFDHMTAHTKEVLSHV